MGFWQGLKSIFGRGAVGSIADTVQVSSNNKAAVKQAEIISDLRIKEAELNSVLQLKKITTDNKARVNNARTKALVDAYKAGVKADEKETERIGSTDRIAAFMDGTKDEFVVYTIFGIIIYAMIPGCAQYVEAGSAALLMLPDWLPVWGASIVAAIFGVDKAVDITTAILGIASKRTDEIIKLKEALYSE